MKSDSNSDAPGRRVGLSIAGFDPSSGAGVTADLQVFAAHQIYGMAAITALTVQSTQGVMRIEAVAPELLSETLDCLGKDVSFAGVKIGMLATGENVRAVTNWLSEATTGRGSDKEGFSRNRVVLDPVLSASSGAVLSGTDAVEAIRTGLLGKVGWITPNWSELAALTAMKISRREDLPGAATRLQEMARSAGNPCLNIVATGGDQIAPSCSQEQTDHQNSERQGSKGQGSEQPGCDDLLLTSTREQFWLKGERVNTTSTHGTGCAFSTALACELIAGKDAFAACLAAKAYVTRALQTAYPIGQGRGPLNLFV